VLFLGDGILKGNQAVKVDQLLLAGHWVVHLGGGGALTGGVDEGEQSVETDLLQHLQGVLEFFGGLARKTDDNVGGEDDVRNQRPEGSDFFQIFRLGVAAVHHLKDPVVSGLEGQMEHRGHLFAPGHGLEELLGGVFGVGCHEADEKITWDGVDRLQQVGEVHGLFQVLAVGVDVLTQQGDVLIALLHQLADLGQNVLWIPGTLTAPDVGDNAVGTEVVAAVHNGHPGFNLVLAHYRNPFGDGTGLLLHGEDPAPLGEQGVDHLREFPQRLGAEDQIHVAVRFPQLLGRVRLLGHAPAQADKLLWVPPLYVDQGAHIAENPLFGVFPDGTGVDNDDCGLLLAGGEAVAHLGQPAPEPFGVGLVLLAPIGVHKGQGRLGLPGVELGYGLTVVQLCLDLGGGNKCGVPFHKYLQN
jgi:hypothetical protein